MIRLAKSCCRNIRTRNEAGITFLEVLASLALIAFLVAVLSEFLYNGVRLWAANDRGYLAQQRSREIYLNLQQDIAPAYLGSYLPAAAVRGNETELSFWREEPAGLMQIKYIYDPQEKVITRSAGFWSSYPEESYPEVNSSINGLPENKIAYRDITAWNFEYYQPSADQWTSEWEPEDTREVPSLIRITVTAAGQRLGPFVIPLKAWHGKAKDDQ